MDCLKISQILTFLYNNADVHLCLNIPDTFNFVWINGERQSFYLSHTKNLQICIRKKITRLKICKANYIKMTNF